MRTRSARRRRALALLLGASLSLLLAGALAPSTFSSNWTATDEYQTTTFSTAALGPPASLAVTARGSTLSLAWTTGTNGTSQLLSGVDTATSAGCGSGLTFSPVAVLPPGATSYNDGDFGGQSVAPGDHYCYQLTTAYPTATVGLAAALTKGSAVTSLSVGPLPYSVQSGDEVVVNSTTAPEEGEVFVASASAAAGATSVAVTSKSANFSYPTTSTVSDVTSWAEWTSTSAYGSALAGLVPTAVQVTNGGVANSVDAGDVITLTFNQPVTAPAVADDVCVIAPSTIVLDDTASPTCAGATTSDTSGVGTLVAGNGGSITGSSAYTASYRSSGDTLVITLTGGSGSTTAASTTQTWRYTASGSLPSAATPVADACTSATCQPTSAAGSGF